MGGNAFPPATGSRMTSAQLHKLEAHCKDRLVLSGVFPRAEMFYYTSNKATHGDLDLVVSYPDAMGPPYMRGTEKIFLDSAPSDEELAKNVHLGNFRFSKDETTRAEETRRMDHARATAFAAARAIGADAFNRNGNVISMRLPCHVVCEGFGKEDFFQVDLMLTTPEEFDFNIFVTSYSSTILLLATAIRRLSPSLTLHNNNFTIKHSPYPGQPGVEIVLCRDPRAFAAWLGLDYERWTKHDFDSPAAMYAWISDVPETSVIARAWRGMARSKVREKTLAHIKKVAELDNFYDFLRTTKWAGSPKGIAEGDKVDITGAQLAELTVGDSKDASPASSLEIAAEPVITAAPRLLPQPATDEIPRLTLDEIADAKAALVDLNKCAKAALDYFGKRAEWDKAVAQRSIKADEVWRARLMHAYRKPYKKYGEDKDVDTAEQEKAKQGPEEGVGGDDTKNEREMVGATAGQTSPVKADDESRAQ